MKSLLGIIVLIFLLHSSSITYAGLEKDYNSQVFLCDNTPYYGFIFKYTKSGNIYTFRYDDGKYTVYDGGKLLGKYDKLDISWGGYYTVVGNNKIGFIEENAEGKKIVHFGDFTSEAYDSIKLFTVSKDDASIYYVGFDKNSDTETLLKNETILDTGYTITEFSLSEDGRHYGYLKYTGKPKDGNFSLIKDGKVLSEYNGKSHWIDSLGFLRNNSVKFQLSDNNFSRSLVIDGKEEKKEGNLEKLDIFGNGDIFLEKDYSIPVPKDYDPDLNPTKNKFIIYKDKKSEFSGLSKDIFISDDYKNIYYISGGKFFHNFNPSTEDTFSNIYSISFNPSMDKYAFIGYKTNPTNVMLETNYIMSDGKLSEALPIGTIKGPFYSEDLGSFITFNLTQNTSFSGYTDIDIYENTEYRGTLLRKGFSNISYNGKDFFIEDSIGGGYYSSDKCSFTYKKEQIVSKEKSETPSNTSENPKSETPKNNQFYNTLDKKIKNFFSKTEKKLSRSKVLYQYKKIIESLEKSLSKKSETTLEYLLNMFKERYVQVLKQK